MAAIGNSGQSTNQSECLI